MVPVYLYLCPQSSCFLPSYLGVLNHGSKQGFQERPNVRSEFLSIIATVDIPQRVCTFSNGGGCQAKLKPAGKRRSHAINTNNDEVRVVVMCVRSTLLGYTNSTPARVDQGIRPGHNLHHERKRGATPIPAALSRTNDAE